MTVYGMWFGGHSYSTGDPVLDVEEFPTIADAKSKFGARFGADTARARFRFVNREEEFVYCPGVDDTASMWLWFDLPRDEGGRVDSTDCYPDRVMTRGPRGGVRVDES